MIALGKKSHGIVLLPVGAAAAQDDRRLARAHLTRSDPRAEPLNRVLSLLGLPPRQEGLAALRWWGQTGSPPDRWLCGADPVYLEARLDHLCLHAVPDITETELAALLAQLHDRLSTGRSYAFAALGECGYLLSDEPMETAGVSAGTADGHSPARFLPGGSGTGTHDRLQSELQMCLHDAEPNLVRARTGQLPVNSLWFWGGGTAPAAVQAGLPPLFGDDPLFRGHWLNGGAETAGWPGRMEDCASRAPDGFVAVMPSCGDADIGAAACIRDGRRLLAQGIGRVTLLFRDGVVARMRRSDPLRFWHSNSGFFAGPAGP